MQKTELLAQIQSHFSHYGINADADHMRYIGMILDGWMKIRPLTVQSLPDNNVTRLTMVSKNAYKIQKNLFHEIGFLGYHEELYRFSNKNFHVHRFDFDQKKLVVSIKEKQSWADKIKKDDGRSESYQQHECDLASLFDATKCQADVEDLQDSILNSLEVFGLAADSNDFQDEDPSKVFKKSLSEILGRFERERRQDAFKQFEELMKPEMLQIMRDANAEDTRVFNWLYAEGNEQLQKYRLQAAQAYPAFLRVFAGVSSNPFPLIDELEKDSLLAFDRPLSARDILGGHTKIDDKSISLLMNDIDNARSFMDSLGGCLVPKAQVSKRTLRNLGRIKEMPQNMDYQEFLTSVQYLDDLDGTWHPKTAMELKNFVEAANRAISLSRSTGRPVAEILKRSKGQWQNWNEKTVSLEAVKNVSDWLKEVHTVLLEPNVLYHTNPDKLKKVGEAKNSITGIMLGIRPEIIQKHPVLEKVFSHVSEPEMLACSQRWHEQGEAYSANKAALKVGNDFKLGDWLPLTKPVQAPDGIRITPLTSSKDLAEEGKAMHHCVGWNNYDAKCQTQNDHIISFADKDGRRLCTVQLRDHFSEASPLILKTKLKVVQQQGHGRHRIQESLQWYLAQIASNPEMKPDWSAIEELRETYRKALVKQGCAEHFGYDPMVDSKREEAFKAIQPYLPARFRHYTYQKFIDFMAAADAFKEENKTKEVTLSSSLINLFHHAPGYDAYENINRNFGVP